MMILSRNFLILLSVFLFGCEEVIELDLNESIPTLVVEATIHQDDVIRVKLSLTSPYYNSSVAKNISCTDAVLTLQDNNGDKEELICINEGSYQGQNIFGKPNTSYDLVIDFNGSIYTAKSRMPMITLISKLSYAEHDGSNFGPDEKSDKQVFKVTTSFKDDAAESNYYRLKHYLNGDVMSRSSEYLVFSDELINGRDVNLSLERTNFNLTDTVSVELISFDQNVYEYFHTFGKVRGSNQMASSTPFNPTSNFDNGALGYFSAQAVSKAVICIK